MPENLERIIQTTIFAPVIKTENQSKGVLMIV